MVDELTRRRALVAATGTGVVGGAFTLFGARGDDSESVRAPDLVVDPRFDVAGQAVDCRLGDGDVPVWFVHEGGEPVSTSELVVIQPYGTPRVTVADCDGEDGTFEAGDGVVVGVPRDVTVRFVYSPGGEPVSDASDFAVLATARVEGDEPAEA